MLVVLWRDKNFVNLKRWEEITKENNSNKSDYIKIKNLC